MAAAVCDAPSDTHCLDACSYWNGVCNGRCENGYWGPRCNKQCSEACLTCNGGSAYDCLECTPNAYWDSRYGCKCYNGYSGSLCLPAKEIDCDPKCLGGCDGPEDTNCYQCVMNATKDQYGRCVCSPNWSGDDCTIYVENLTYECDPKCVGCTGPSERDCIHCTSNCNKDYAGFCMCDAYWSGDDCSIYIGPCHPSCFDSGGCSGPTASDCVTCFPNATRDEFGNCICDLYWTGRDCSKYAGPCNDKCFGCHGPKDSDCELCATNAYLDGNETCVCLEDWGGPQCREYCGTCNQTCETCRGPLDTDCEYCVEHAVWDGYGRCVCEYSWAGDTCTEYVGKCDAICHGCHGPSSAECTECAVHASRDSNNHCACEIDWNGQNCQFFTGSCDRKCNGCHGPGPTNCNYCVSHSYLNDKGECDCEPTWSGEDCNTYDGLCSSKCEPNGGCAGPSAADCNFCGENSSRNQSGICVCEINWTGDDCRVYIGECDPLCLGCDGQGPAACEMCVPHSSRDGNGICVCDDYWEGTTCESYAGNCHPRCNGCVGPHDTECIQCVENANLMSNGMGENSCQCEPYWSSQDCSTYHGLCDYKCHPDYPCDGPDANDCFMCNKNAQLNDVGDCICKNDWSGINCYEYSGHCDLLCQDGACSGPGPENCTSCIDNAHRNTKGECVCNDDFVGAECQYYNGDCDPICQDCVMPGATGCVDCVPHATAVNGKCVCDTDWSGEDCTRYAGSCADTCNGCTGPSNQECILCVANALRNASGVCECSAGWDVNSSCSQWTGVCYHTCETCTGPGEGECSQCVEYAVRDSYGICRCIDEWGGDGCATYEAFCHNLCVGCTGPYNTDCISCKNMATEDINGACQCLDPYYGEQCNQYSGTCSHVCDGCLGSTEFDCVRCVENAHWTTDGACVCDDNFVSSGCSVYTGACHVLCNSTCTGPWEYHCDSCIPNAHRNPVNGACQCNEYYTGDDCQLYTGECHCRCEFCTASGADSCLTCANEGATIEDGCACQGTFAGECCHEYSGSCESSCDSCSGPAASNCIKCRQNAHWSINGCVCHSDWVGDDTCTTYSGVCPAICLGCSDSITCDDCVQNACRDSNGDCKCLDDWYGDACDVYAGRCHALCDGCNEAGADNCIACISNATLVDGSCQCNTDWFGDDCMTYIGLCHEFCLSCTGPGAAQCVACVPNAHRLVEGENAGNCECQTDWDPASNCASYIGNCHPSCLTCTGANEGPYSNNCTQCVDHSYWSEYGDCTCDTCWNSDLGCSGYSCECDPKCNLCVGPGPAACLGCVEHASATGDNNECTCDENWGGVDCSYYTGVCHSLCDGCSGPDLADCIYCINHAHRSVTLSTGVQGACECDANWTGDQCDQRQEPCHPSCLTCSGPDSNECETCNFGFVLTNGSCQACPEDCKTCTDSNTCETCYSNYALDPADNRCRRCHPTCSECTEAQNAAKCSSCYFDAVLEAEKCKCDDPLMMDSATWKCVDACFTGFEKDDATNECIPSTAAGFTFDFLTVTPFDSEGVIGDYCNPPIVIDQRGGYFDGGKASIAVSNFQPYNTARYVTWVSIEEPSSTIFAMYAHFWKYTENYYNGRCDWVDCSDDYENGLVDLWITPCFAYSVTFGNTVAVSEERSYPGGWKYIEYRYTVEEATDFSVRTVIELRADDELQLSANSDQVILPHETENFHIGSHRGHLYNMRGFVYSARYLVVDAETLPAPDFSTTCDACAACPEDGVCLSQCSHNQFIDGDGCTNCHPSCYQGCTEAGSTACLDEYYCHPSCRTCEGPGEEECTECYCGAHRSNADTDKSSCECDIGTTGSGCETICVEGCDVCEGNDDNECLMCAQGYILDDYTFGRCVSCENERAYNPTATCENRGPKQITGSCTCSVNQWYDVDAFKCKECELNCVECDNSGRCLRCEDGYLFPQDTGLCTDICPSGSQEQLGVCTSPAVIVADFTFQCDDTKVWTCWQHYHDFSHSWETTAYLGYDPQHVTDSDPYLTDDRGLFFDGKNDYVTLTGLMLNTSYTLSLWVNPHMDGTLFTSSSRTNGHYYSLGLAANRARYEDTFNGYIWVTTAEFVESMEWQMIAMSVNWTGSQSDFKIYKNGLFVDTTSNHWVTLDRPDSENHHFLGAHEKLDALYDYYTGYIYTIRVSNRAVANFNDMVLEGLDCGIECDFCPENAQCLGTCSSNSYWNGYKCTRCPSWCTLGCQSNGTC